MFESSREVVAKDEELWSSLLKQWVPIGSGLVHTLISIDSEQIMWMNEEGLFRASVDDIRRKLSTRRRSPAVPRELVEDAMRET